VRDGGADEAGKYTLRFEELVMTELTEDRRLVFYDVEDAPYRPVRDGGSGRSVFKIKPKGASNLAAEAIHTEEWLEVARAMLVDGLAARCQPLPRGQVNYLKFGAEKLVRYELDPEIAQSLGIPERGTANDLAGIVSRRSVEEAMDAFDRFRSNGEGADMFELFGNPREYWVRSTRDRQDRVYPTKPLIGHILKKTELNGGWGQSSDAAARLHNAGFIIVDQEGNPVAPPERYEHLMRGADRIRLCALNYFIEPARENGLAEVAIRSGDLSTALGLVDVFPNICQALGGEKFQQMAKVPAPTCTEPNPSSSTIFTFKLGSQAKVNPVTDLTKPAKSPTTNLILYGPPGTGKTYETAWEAVQLCLGNEAAAPLRGPDKRVALMAAYKQLVDEGRIAFVTFHQSMSYEEFVEGLRPKTGVSDANVSSDLLPESGGFRLEPEEGLFKAISERARLDQGGKKSGSWLDRKQTLFKLSMIGNNWRPGFEYSIQKNRIFWLFGGKVDWSAPEYEQFDAIKERWQQDHPEATGQHASVSGTWYFRTSMEQDDYVLLTVGKSRLVAVGRVVGPYEYRPDFSGQEVEGTPHSRAVEWIWHDEKGIERAQFYPKTFSSFQPIYIIEDQVDWDELEKAIFPNRRDDPARTIRPYVLIIDEINRANISKVFGELITLLETDKRLGTENEIRLTLPYSKKPFGVPANLHIIGTMNTADRSIALLDTALRRRFTFRELMPDPSVLPANVGGINLQKLLRTINDRIEYMFDRDHQIGHAYFTSCATRDDVEAVMRHKVIPLLAEYFYEDWSKVAAVLGDAKQDNPRFLLREDLKAPEGMENDSFPSVRQRWRVKPVRDSDGTGGFNFAEFEA
jgi:5-methylcytosine-specific restriction protein B